MMGKLFESLPLRRNTRQKNLAGIFCKSDAPCPIKVSVHELGHFYELRGILPKSVHGKGRFHGPKG